MEIDLSCPNCSNDYQESNPPRLLSCGHTYCQGCLVSFTKTEENHTFLQCPQDQNMMAAPENIQQLPINLALIRLIQSRKKNSSNTSNASMRDASFDMSKINKEQECQEDELAQQLISQINRATQRKQNSSEQQPVKTEVQTQDTQTNYEKPTGKKKQLERKQKKSKEDQDVCLLHQRPIEVICMNDYERLCSKCALFGEHKTHEFKGIQQIEAQNQKFYQKVISVFESKENIMEKAVVEKIENDLLQVLDVRATKIKRQIADNFKKINEEIQKAEKQALHQLQNMKISMQKCISESLRPETSLIQSYDKWQLSTLELIKESEQSTTQGSIKFYLKRDEVMKKGLSLVKELKQFQDHACNYSVQLIEEFNVTFNQQNFKKILYSLVSVNNKHNFNNNEKIQKKVPQKMKQNEATLANCWMENIKNPPSSLERHQSDESLLDACEYEMHSLAGSEVGSRILDQSFVSVQENHHLNHKQSHHRQNTTRPLIKRKILPNPKEKEKCLIKQAPSHINIHNSAKRKAKNIKVPEKYEKVIQGIIADSLDTVDLTNAELGDAVILQILEMMKDNKKVKTLKLIRNKITDDGILKFIPYLGNLVSLNLSQNVLTQNVLNLIIDYRASFPQLKSLVMSQTKIIERKSKPLIEKVKKTGLSVSV